MNFYFRACPTVCFLVLFCFYSCMFLRVFLIVVVAGKKKIYIMSEICEYLLMH